MTTIQIIILVLGIVVVAVLVAMILAITCLLAVAMVQARKGVVNPIEQGIAAVKHVGGKFIDLFNLGKWFGPRLQLRAARQQVVTMEAKLQEVNAELARYQAMRLNIDNIRSLFMVALLETDSHLDDRVEKVVSEKQRDWFRLGQASIVKYIGILKVEFKLRLGLDLDATRFSMASNRTIYIHGLRDVITIGTANIHMTWLSRDFRRVAKRHLKVIPAYTKVISDEGITAFSDPQEQAVLKKLDDPAVVSPWMIDAVAKSALEKLSPFFALAGYWIREPFAGDQERTMTIVQLVDKINRPIDVKIMQLQTERNSLLVGMKRAHPTLVGQLPPSIPF